MKLKALFIAVFAISYTQTAWSEPQNPMIDGTALAWQCAPCHGTNGQELTEAMPAIAGMPEQQIVESMMAFRAGTRPAIIMDRVSRGFTDDEIKAMAAFFARQPRKQWSDTTLEEAVAVQSTGDKQ